MEGEETVPLVIAVPKELAEGEKRVALVPEVVQKLTKAGHEVRIEHDAGTRAYYPDDLFAAAGARITSSRVDLLKGAQVVACVQPPGRGGYRPDWPRAPSSSVS